MNLNILVLPGDGIGTEVTGEAVRVLRVVAEKWKHQLTLREGLLGGIAIHKTGTPFPAETEKLSLEADAVLMGAVGLPEFDNAPPEKRPERGLLGIRKAMGVLRQSAAGAQLQGAARFLAAQEPSRRRRDMIIVRELTGGLYYGTPRGISGEGMDEPRRQYDGLHAQRDRARRAHGFRTGPQAPQEADVGRQIERARNFAALAPSGDRSRDGLSAMSTLDHLLVDNCAMQLVLNPKRFDVVVTENMFGDILSDEGAVLAGSIGMLPSASIGAKKAVRRMDRSVRAGARFGARISRDKTKPIRSARSVRWRRCSNTASDLPKKRQR